MTFGIYGGKAGPQWTGAAGRIGRGRSGLGAQASGRYRLTMQRVRVNVAADRLSTRAATVLCWRLDEQGGKTLAVGTLADPERPPNST